MTNEIKVTVCVQNLGKYNEGELVFKWLSLPASSDEIAETLKEIGIDGVKYEEYMIADFEAPFKIGEYDSLQKWNEIAEKLENIELIDFDSNYNWDYVDNLCSIKNLASEFDFYELVEDYYTMEEVEELELYPMHENGKVDLTRMYFFLGDTTANTDIVLIDGYGNLKEVRKNELEELQSEVLEAIINEM